MRGEGSGRVQVGLKFFWFAHSRSAGVKIRGGICAIFGGPVLFTTLIEHLFVHGGGPKKWP